MIFYLCILGIVLITCSSIWMDMNIKSNAKTVSINNDNRFWIAILLMIFIASIRYGIGYDYYRYVARVEAFNSINYSNNYEYISRFIFFVANKLKNPQLVFVIYSIIIYGCIGKAIADYSIDKNEAVIIYFCIFYIESLSTIRQAAAVSVVLLGYKYIKDKKLIKYILVCIIATLIHQFAFFAIAIYFVYYISTTVNIVVSIVAFILSNYMLNYLAPKFYIFRLLSVYLKRTDQSGKIWLVLYTLIFIYVFFILILIKRKNNLIDKEIKRLLNVVFIGTICPYVLGTGNGHRIGEYFLIFHILLLALCNNKLNKSMKYAFNIMIIIVYIGYLYTTIRNGQYYIPYVSIWNVK